MFDRLVDTERVDTENLAGPPVVRGGFVPDSLDGLGRTLESTLMDKYGLPVTVSEPKRGDGNVSTWKLRLETKPAARHLPAQRIHIDLADPAFAADQPVLLHLLLKSRAIDLQAFLLGNVPG
mgnify:CR=1 FL=1